jgi:LPS sulfotransferase NodH
MESAAASSSALMREARRTLRMSVPEGSRAEPRDKRRCNLNQAHRVGIETRAADMQGTGICTMDHSNRTARRFGHARRFATRFNAEPLPPHPYQDQFSVSMDSQEVSWAKRFVLIASTPRCGSHFLGHMLGETGQCGVPLEYLNGKNRVYWARRFGTDRIETLFPEIVRHRTSANGTFTMKAHWNHFQPHVGSIEQLTGGLGIEKTIWLSRRNQLSQAISFTIARQTGVWISGAVPNGNAKFNYGGIVRSAEKIRNANLCWRKYIAALPAGRSMTLVYEDLLSDASIRIDLTRFLDLGASLQPSDRTRPQGDAINAEWRERFLEKVTDEDRWILERPAWMD